MSKSKQKKPVLLQQDPKRPTSSGHLRKNAEPHAGSDKTANPVVPTSPTSLPPGATLPGPGSVQESSTKPPSRDTHRWLEPLTSLQKFFLCAFPLILFASFIRIFLGERVHPLYEFGWTFGFTLAVLGQPFIYARRRILGRLINHHATSEPIFNELYTGFIQRHEEGWEPLVIACIGGGVFACFRLIVSWDSAPYSYEISRWTTVIVGTLGFAFLTRTIWLFLAFGWLMGRLSAELEKAEERLFSWDVLEAAGRGYVRTALGASLLSLAVFWITLTTSRLFALQSTDLADEFFFAFGIFLLSVIIPMTYFLVPQWRLHRMLVKRKKQIRDLFSAKLHEFEHSLLKTPDRSLAEKYLQERRLLVEIENLPEWPFTYGSIARIITIVAVPAFLFLFKEVLVDVLVEMVKR
ncbi:MAG: hypothetical protein WA705_22710 [Candidatus Ozemobacteraceae bacterium]